MLVIHTLFLHQFRMEYLHEVAEHDVRIHDGRLVIVVTPAVLVRALLLYTSPIFETSGIGEFRT